MRLSSRLIAACFAVLSSAAPALAVAPPVYNPTTHTTTYTLPNKMKATIGVDGIGWQSMTNGRHAKPISILRSSGKDVIGGTSGLSDLAIQRRLAMPDRGQFASGQVIVVFRSGVSIVGSSAATQREPYALKPLTTDTGINSALQSMRASSISPMFGGMSRSLLFALGSAARARLGPSALDPANAYVAKIGASDPMRAAATLRALPMVQYSEPNWYVQTFAVDPKPFPKWAVDNARRASSKPSSQTNATVPGNYGVSSSLQSHLNANGVDAIGAYVDIKQRYGQLPGQGEIVTNVSLGDLMDQQMIDGGDQYAAAYGPDSEMIGNQRYLDFPSLPLIPTYVADSSGNLSGSASVEHVDPFLGEVLLDFGVMAPLPHGQQRPGEQGIGLTDLLGVAPGAQYRLVVPQQPTFSNIAMALLGAAQQQPRPNVMTASLGFGFDAIGFPGRYLEEDPLAQAIIASIVQYDGVVVCISANDGTRLFTPAAIGPDGGSAPTMVAAPGTTGTTLADITESTVPSLVFDSGAIDVGGTTTDDIFGVPPQRGGAFAGQGVFTETRIDGETDFSSGFGERVNVAAPSDNIPSFVHFCFSSPCTPHDIVPVLSGGTSASAPMTAAAAAVVLQVARLTGHTMDPRGVRALLVATGRAVVAQPQIDRMLNVGPQIDVTAAAESLLPAGTQSTRIVRLAVAERQDLGAGGALFEENVDPTAIELSGPPDFIGNPSGENTVSPITFAADIINLPKNAHVTYDLRVGSQGHVISHDRTPREMPSRLFSAAGLPLASTTSRSFPVTFIVRVGLRTIASATQVLTFGPDSGQFEEALAPIVAPVVPAGRSVTVEYNLTNVIGVFQPHLIVSSVGHWSPFSAPLFHAAYDVAINGVSGTVAVPASVFTGGGLYGVGIETDTQGGFFGNFQPFRVEGAAAAQRPDAPQLAPDGHTLPGHFLAVTRAKPTFTVTYDVTRVPGANGATLEISAPAPTLHNLFNTFTNQNGTVRDDNGVDSGSSAFLPLGGTAGSRRLNATELKLTSSDLYTVRVLATAGGTVIGQASPVSALEYDDAITPGGEPIVDFDVTPAGGSVVSTAAFDNFGNPADAALFAYDQTTETYGAPLAHDASGQTIYTLFGDDPSLHHTIVQQFQWLGTTQWVQSYDNVTGALLRSIPVDSSLQFFIVGGRVDAVRHSAQVLAYDSAGADVDLPFRLQHLAMGPPINADNGARGPSEYNALDIDASTGKVYFSDALTGDLCIFLAAQVTEVDPIAGTNAPAQNVDHCMTGLVSDQGGSNLYTSLGPLIAFPQLLPPARFQTVSDATLQKVGDRQLDGRSPMFPAYDPVHHLLLLAELAPSGFYVDNNAMSQVAVFNTTTGHLEKLIRGFNFVNEAFFSPVFIVNERGIQIDPATRTGWTYGPAGTQVQQFQY